MQEGQNELNDFDEDQDYSVDDAKEQAKSVVQGQMWQEEKSMRRSLLNASSTD